MTKWVTGKLAPNGYTYFIPSYANQILEVDTRPPKNMTRKSAVGGLNDSTKNSPDRLGYNVYADGLSEVVRSVENPSTSLCVGLFGPWGSGKSFLWKLIKHELETKSNQPTDEIEQERKKTENAPVGFIERSCVLAWGSWCTFARMLSSVFCRCFSNLKEEEKVALMMIFSFPVGIPVWIVVFAGNVVPRIILILVCYGLWIVCGPFKYNYEKYEGKLDEDESLNKYMHLGFQGVWRSISGLKDMKKKDNVFVITTCCSPSSEELKWSSVREILFSNPDLFKRKNMSGSGCAIFVLFIILSFFQQKLKSVKEFFLSLSSLFRKDSQTDMDMTQYVFVDFNVSQ